MLRRLPHPALRRPQEDRQDPADQRHGILLRNAPILPRSSYRIVRALAQKYFLLDA